MIGCDACDENIGTGGPSKSLHVVFLIICSDGESEMHFCGGWRCRMSIGGWFTGGRRIPESMLWTWSSILFRICARSKSW